MNRPLTNLGTVYYTNSTQQASFTSTTSPVAPTGSITLPTQLLTSAPGSSLATAFSCISVGTHSSETSIASISSNATHGFGTTATAKNNSADLSSIQTQLPSSSVDVGAYILNGLGSSSIQTTQSSNNIDIPDASTWMLTPMGTRTAAHTTISTFIGSRHNASSATYVVSASSLAPADYSSPARFSISVANVTFAAQFSGTVRPSAPVLPTSRVMLNATHVASTRTQNSTSRASLYIPKPSGNASLYPANVSSTYGDACQASYVAWSEVFQPNATTSTVTRIESNHSLTFHATYGHANVYTTISGFPRAHGTLTPTSVTRYVTRYLQTNIETQTHTSTRNASFASPSPTCAISTAQCSSMWQTYLSSLGLSTSTNLANVTEPTIIPTPSNRPRCALGDIQNTCSTLSSDKGQCQIEAGFGQIFYWPTYVVDGLNGTSKSNITRTQHYDTSKPITATFWNAIMTYPSVYLFIDGLSTRVPTVPNKHCVTISPLGASTTGSSIGSASKKGQKFDTLLTLLELEPTGLSSLIRDLGPGVNTASAVSAIAHGGQDYQKWMQRIVTNTVLWNNSTTAAYQVRSMDYRQMGAPPAEAYYLRPDGAPGCNVRGPHPECSTIFEGAYIPQLAVPTQIRAIDPSFADCAAPLFGKFGKPQPVESGVQYGANFKKHPEMVHTSVSTQDDPCTFTCRGCCRAAVPNGGSAAQVLTSVSSAATSSIPTVQGLTSPIQTHNNAPTGVPNDSTINAGAGTEGAQADLTVNTPGATPAAVIMTILASSHAQESLNSQGVTTPAAAATSGADSQAPNDVTNAISVLAAALQTQSAVNPAGPLALASVSSNALDRPTVGSAPSQQPLPTPAATPTPSTEGVGDATNRLVQAIQTDRLTFASSVQASAAVVTIAGSVQTVSAATNANDAIVGGSTLSVGEQAGTVKGQTISAIPGGVVVNGQTVQYSPSPAAPQISAGAIVTINGQVLTASQVNGPATVQLGPSILSVGGSPATIAGQTISLGSAGLVFQEGSQVPSTIALGAVPSVTQHAVPVTLGSQVVTAAGIQPGTFVLGSLTLSVGGPAVTISGGTISAAASGLVVNGQGLSLQGTGSSQSGVVLSASSNIVTADEVQPGVFVLGTTTLRAGGSAITAGGETISAVGPGLVVGGRTQLASTLPTSTARGLELSRGVLTATATQTIPGVFVLGSQTISAGGPPATISGQTISAVASGIVIAGQTITASSLQSGSQASVVSLAYLGLPKATEISPGVFSLGSTTLSVGGPALTTLGHTISAGPLGLVAVGTLYTASGLQAVNTGVVVGEGSSPATASEVAPGIFVVGAATLTAGGAAKTISGYTISAALSGVIVDGTSYAASSPSPTSTGVIFTEGTTLATATEISPGTFVFGSVTLSAGGSARTISGQIISAANDGLVINGKTSTASALTARPISGVLLTESFQQLTATELRPGVFALDSLTLTAGGPAATIDGETISAISDGLVVDGRTMSASLLQGSTSRTSGITTQASISAASLPKGLTQQTATSTQKPKKSFATRIALWPGIVWAMVCISLMTVFLG